VVGGAVGDGLFERGVSLPCATELTERDQERVIAGVRSFFRAGGPTQPTAG
jgi:dTDP-4-amino-4,6-dideoxygalactose transaminase